MSQQSPEIRRVHLNEHLVPECRLGRHVEHDPRSRAFGIVRRAVELKTVHHRHYGVLDQGDVGSCTGNATVGALNTVPNRATGTRSFKEDTAVEVYSLATELDGFPGVFPPDDTGSSGLAACKAAKQLGLISEYRHAFGIDDALAALQERAVITGVPWYEGMDNPDERGMVRIAGQIRGGHEFVVIGYEWAKVALDAVVWAVQSWKLPWGYRGRGRFGMTVGMWGTLLEDSGDATVPVV